MKESILKCEECQEPLKPSMYARVKKEGQPAADYDKDLVCRNSPSCSKSEKEITNK